MCRIAGIVSKNADKALMHRQVITMCNSLQNGGPDDEGIFANDDGLVFGHRRLSIIDLSQNGHQPMSDVLKSIWITFNGEIYNYRELKADLLSGGAVFQSGTDTEVIVQAYLHWGTKAFAKLRGIFAFALYDAQNKLTYLIRDSMGVKPLYYHISNGQLSFASEVRAFKAAQIVNEENVAWRMRFLAFGHVPEPETTLKNVFCLAKGHMLCWNNVEQTFTITSFISKETSVSVYNKNEARDIIADSLRAAVKRQLIADAPIGVFLSGGADSSLITLLAAEQKQDQLKTISIFFNEKAYDEHAYQNLIANKLNGENHYHLVTEQQFDLHLPEIIAAMDMPTTDGVNSWFISKYAHQDGLKAVLSGLGADELFGGYPSFIRISSLRALQNLPSFLFNGADHVLGDRYKKLSYLANSAPLALYLSMRALFTAKDIAKLLDADEKQVTKEIYDLEIPTNANLTDKELAGWLESNIYMQNQLLRDTDVMSMSHGLEVRVPFLDEDFQNAVRTISPDLLYNGNEPKKILIDSFKNILPEAIWNRPKMGFSFPLQQWMRNHHEIADEDFYSNNYAKKIVRKFKTGETHWSKAFTLYLTQLHAC